MEDREQWSLEDLSHDVYIWQKVKLVHLPWFGLALVAGLFLTASLPIPWPIMRIVMFWIPPVAMAVWINLDGPRLFRQWWTWRRRIRVPDTARVFFAPDADAMAMTATPICELPNNTWMAAALVQAPPYTLAGPTDRATRRRAWASLLNTAAAHGVQVDIFAARNPWARAYPLLASVHLDEHDGPLAHLARWRVRHFTEQAVARGYETTLVVRLITGARDAAEAWHMFAACRSAFEGVMSWEWISGAYLAELAYAWADPGAALRRFVREVERALDDYQDRGREEARRAG